MRFRTLVLLACAVALAIPASGFGADVKKKRTDIDKNERETLAKLYKEQPAARNVVKQAYGYAVFHSTQTALMISGGSGKGVAVNNKTGKRIYMKMASAGAGVGIGVQVMDVVFAFETPEKFNQFVDKGWDGDASASGAAGTKGISEGSSFVEGMAVYQMTDKGLIAQASLKGTKYWTDDKLNGAEKK
jgi:lipid-binding SYLF domain-containing protein